MRLLTACIALALCLSFVSCQQEPDFGLENTTNPNTPGTPPGTTPPGNNNAVFEAKINGQLTTFNVLSATLLRSTQTNEKRMDITGQSTDGTKRLILTFGDTPASGNGIAVKDYIVRLFNEDDPNTPQDESDDSMDGFTTYSTSLGNNSWVTDVYAENGVMKVTSCDASAKKVSGTFIVKDSSLTGGPVLHFTEGKFTNISYMVLN